MIFPGRPSAKVKRSKSPRLSFRILSLLVAVLHVLSVNPVAQAATYTGGVGSGDASAEGGSVSAPAKLAFSVQPTAANAYQVFDPQPVIIIQDRNGNAVDPTSECTISLSLYNNPGGAILGGTTSMTSIAGVANFKNKGLFVDKAGQLYTLRATASGGSCSDVTPAVSSSFDISIPAFQVKAELLYDSSAVFAGKYFVNSWLEGDGQIISDSSWSCSSSTTTCYHATGTTASAPYCTTVANSKTVFKMDWYPEIFEESFMVTVSIRYPAGTGPWYSGRFVFTPVIQADSGGGGFTETDRTMLGAIKSKTDTINWSDIGAIKTAVGAGQEQTVYDKVGAVLTSVSKANWDDIQAMSQAGVNWAGVKAQAGAQVNWDDIRALSRAGIQWAQIMQFSAAGINWDDMASLTDECLVLNGKVPGRLEAAIRGDDVIASKVVS